MTLNERTAKVKSWNYDDECAVAFVRIDGGKLRFRDWSGNIADAWELAEELPQPLIIVGPVDDPDIPDGNQWDVNCAGCSVKGRNIREAICLAWLAVYEATSTPHQLEE